MERFFCAVSVFLRGVRWSKNFSPLGSHSRSRTPFLFSSREDSFFWWSFFFGVCIRGLLD